MRNKADLCYLCADPRYPPVTRLHGWCLACARCLSANGIEHQPPSPQAPDRFQGLLTGLQAIRDEDRLDPEEETPTEERTPSMYGA